MTSEHFSWSSGSLRLDEVAFLEVSVRLITPVWCGVWSPPEADDSSQMGACEDAVSATYLQGRRLQEKPGRRGGFLKQGC